MRTMVLSAAMAICLIALAGPASGRYICLDGERPLVNSNKDSFVCTIKGNRVAGSERDVQTQCNKDPKCTGYEYRHADNFGYLCLQSSYAKRYSTKKCCGAKLCKKRVVGECPRSHPFAYKDGAYCCASNKEKVDKADGATCDGGKISYKSTCCSGDSYKRCRLPKCINHQVIRQCPKSHPFVYRHGKYCCKHNREKVYKPDGRGCDGSKISYSSRCCKDDAYISCPGDICVKHRVIKECPKSHPFVYKHGKYCCKYNHEKVYKPDGRGCDGSQISYSSKCCKDDAYISCSGDTCVRHRVIKECPKSHPFVYRHGRYCCKYNREKVYKPDGTGCDGSRISYSSRCCKDDAYISCQGGTCIRFRGRDTPNEDMTQYKYTFEDEPRRQRQHAVAGIYIDFYEV